ncbi:MAG: hypothetical protein DRP29_05245 [Thermodesulfobacteriota bacterium]|nr:MAG: hypothetical protein DRP29_05245 [Thermodesulfobacteriota bacterium]
MRVLQPFCQIEKLDIYPTQQGAQKRHIWGYHLIVEFWEAPFDILAKAQIVENILKNSLNGNTSDKKYSDKEIKTISYQFQPFGVSAHAQLNSDCSCVYIYIHTWPESGYAAIDIITNNKENAYKILKRLQEAFSPKYVCVAEVVRGVVKEEWGET